MPPPGFGRMSRDILFFVCENLPLGGRFKKAFSYAYVCKTPFDLLKKTCGLATASQTNQKEVTWVTLKV
jgi:hypothetical protein